MLKRIAIAAFITSFAVVSFATSKTELPAMASSATEQKTEMPKHIKHHVHHGHKKVGSKAKAASTLTK